MLDRFEFGRRSTAVFCKCNAVIPCSRLEPTILYAGHLHQILFSLQMFRSNHGTRVYFDFTDCQLERRKAWWDLNLCGFPSCAMTSGYISQPTGEPEVNRGLPSNWSLAPSEKPVAEPNPDDSIKPISHSEDSASLPVVALIEEGGG
ncbi:hypothetical protein AA313_de0204180 [Arthrobotrys entomopaga]|nr:hypothetical protein AA313_de0204180 [Arthrobotrys entomopaga]